MRLGVDTNILVYAGGFDDLTKQKICSDLLRQIPPDDLVLTVQVIAEYHRVLTRKLRSKTAASESVEIAIETYGVIGMDANILPDALKLAHHHHFQIFDALILAQCADAGCEFLLSEDMHDGFSWKGCSIANPLALKESSVIDRILAKLGE